MNIANIVKLSYWFSVATPPFRQSSFAVALVVLGILFAAGIVLRVMANKKRANPPFARGLRNLSRPLFLLSILGIVFVFFRQLGALILSARVWMLALFIIAAVWFAFILKNFLRNFKLEFEKLQAEKKYKEYLPKRNK
ncbi:MAG: hypothetical protein UX17_C0031G0011 [Parcubacteria group bacterium GW2011_GWC2_45_7]|nr:MAG: hypothetical protein UX17_C0031G0011 [Parcubacteria group bacterium GW2011_GWC2_45_7]KKU72918.1 MAG: hypothetical protein UX98_C0014G0011 [Parcubacteria group bacterium GW2011_GWA2_47_26]HBO99876.1 hypothetical protein [Candidatus Uhrbacteria bacterium]